MTEVTKSENIVLEEPTLLDNLFDQHGHRFFTLAAGVKRVWSEEHGYHITVPIEHPSEGGMWTTLPGCYLVNSGFLTSTKATFQVQSPGQEPFWLTKVIPLGDRVSSMGYKGCWKVAGIEGSYSNWLKPWLYTFDSHSLISFPEGLKVDLLFILEDGGVCEVRQSEHWPFLYVPVG